MKSKGTDKIKMWKGNRMENLIVNDTPVRTSRNFLINNIKLENIDIPTNLRNFDSVEIFSNFTKPSNVRDNLFFTYGMGKILEDNINKDFNNSVHLDINTQDSIRINYNFDDNNLKLVNKLEINAKADASVIIVYKSDTFNSCFHNGIVKVNVLPGVKLKIAVVNLLNSLSINFDSFENKLSENASLEYTIIDIGAEKSVSNYYSNLLGEASNNNLKTVYLGTDNQLKDINYIAELRGEKTKINIDVQGALKNHSKKNFKGTIDFKRGCKKAFGDENEYCMLLSEDSRSIALPMLLCTEDDVEGNHSTASGKVEEGALFYIMSRGIEYKEAIKLMVKARFNEIIDRLEDESLKLEILQEIDRKLD